MSEPELTRRDIAEAMRDEARFWMDIPAGQAGGPGALIPPMLLRLADRIEGVTHE